MPRDDGGSVCAHPVVHVRGVVLSEVDLPRILQLISKLCPDEGRLGPFGFYERMYVMPRERRSAATRVATIPDLTLRYILESGSHEERDIAQIEYISQYDRRVEPPCECCTVYHTTVHAGDAETLMSSLMGGATFLFERVRRGYRFRYRTGEMIEVFRVERVTRSKDSGIETVLGRNMKWLVSVRAVVSDPKHAGDSMATKMNEQARCVLERIRQLAPAVLLVPRASDAPRTGWLRKDPQLMARNENSAQR